MNKSLKPGWYVDHEEYMTKYLDATIYGIDNEENCYVVGTGEAAEIPPNPWPLRLAQR